MCKCADRQMQQYLGSLLVMHVDLVLLSTGMQSSHNTVRKLPCALSGFARALNNQMPCLRQPGSG